MKKRTRQVISLIIIICLVSALCLSLYQYNNKRTQNCDKAELGILQVSEKDLQKPMYLIKDWIFYPSQLLKPGDIEKQDGGNYMLYTDIGEVTHLFQYQNSGEVHGSGTYVMHIAVPEKTAVYGLYLPEIFSAYNLYINNSQVFQIGNPEPDEFRSCTQNRMAAFEASGYITILISVSDFSHFYSGIVYPPVFGTIPVLSEMQNKQYGFSVIIITLGILTAGMSLYLGLRIKDRNSFLFVGLCLSMCGFSSYQLVHTLFALPVFPVYTIELVSGYLFSFFTVILHNRICGIRGRMKYISCVIAAGFSVIALFYGGLSAYLNVYLVQYFSTAVFFFKAALSIYLLLTSWIFFDDKSQACVPLFYGSSAYAVFFIWDRIMPDYEPVLGGWYTEWGSYILVIAIGYTLLRDMLSAYSYGLVFAEEKHQMKRQLDMQKAYMEQLSSQISENRKTVHDFRQHLHTIDNLIQQLPERENSKNIRGKLEDYLSSLSSGQRNVHSEMNLSFSSNVAVDALLKYYYSEAEEFKIHTDFRLTLSEKLDFSDVEMCTILGNLLENAIHACCREEKSDSFITLTSRETNSQMFICIENSYNGVFKKEGKHFLSLDSEKERFGIGLESVQEIVKLHSGTVNIYPMDQVFRVGLVLPFKKI